MTWKNRISQNIKIYGYVSYLQKEKTYKMYNPY